MGVVAWTPKIKGVRETLDPRCLRQDAIRSQRHQEGSLQSTEGRKGHGIMRKPPEVPVGLGMAGGVRHREAGQEHPLKCAEQHPGEKAECKGLSGQYLSPGKF